MASVQQLEKLYQLLVIYKCNANSHAFEIKLLSFMQRLFESRDSLEAAVASERIAALIQKTEKVSICNRFY